MHHVSVANSSAPCFMHRIQTVCCCWNSHALVFAACHSSAACRPYHSLMESDVVSAFITQRNSSSPARLGFCLLKGHQSNTGATKATHLRHFSFTPLDTPYGQFRMEVDYAPAAAVNFLEQSTSPKHQPEIISDYVRGAQPADKQRMGHTALRGGLTASLQASQRPSSLLNPAAAGMCCPAHKQHPANTLTAHVVQAITHSQLGTVNCCLATQVLRSQAATGLACSPKAY